MNVAEQWSATEECPEETSRLIHLSVASPERQEEAADAEEDISELARRLSPQRLTEDDVQTILDAAAAKDRTAPHEPLDSMDAATSAPAEAPPAPHNIWSQAALLTSIVFIGLLGVAYFHLNSGVQRLSAELHDLAGIKAQVNRLDSKMGILETQVAELENLPAKTRAALLSSLLHEMAQKTDYMSEQMPSPQQQEKLQRAKELLQQVQTELGASF
jgi:hypothetical protein